ncbi:class I SAM-dependent methyltransferase [Marinobacter sp. F4206]|uniref:class I SAM-dependent methyltransferase n=1 Tax=Marinobacter sp. F4206 TaxID=2861777 RepID=UPI001C5D4380|nr:class I SAM-dependent methyltransferase [Marinobacter sp. F4206]MBW4933661.1 class I SAM-dependent methyltransferase [Marinobacter sp. F4206]
MPAMPNSHEALVRNRSRLNGRVALLGASTPALLSELPSGGLAMSEHAGQAAALATQDHWQVCFGYDDPALTASGFDTVVVFLPKARSELDLRLSLARWLAAPGASLILIGEKKEGIAGAVKQLKAVAPGAEKVDSARHCQVWAASDPASLAEFDLTDWMEWHTVSHAGCSLEVCGLPGIFSQGELDDGTALLLETLVSSPLRAERVLDFACGAGVIGAWYQAWQREQGVPASVVDGVDVQSQAVICARATYERSGAGGDILASDGLSEVDGLWSAIVTNPPFHAGVKTDTSMTENFLREVSRHLKSRGELRLVANSFLPYESMIKRFIGPVERLYEDRRFTVYRAIRR